MMHDDELEQSLRDKVLAALVEKMEDLLGAGMKPQTPEKSMAVEVAAPDKNKLAEGLDKAKEVIAQDGPQAHTEVPAPQTDAEDKSDEERLMELLDEEDEDKEKDKA